MSTHTELKRKRDLDVNSSPALPSSKRQRHEDSSVVTQDAAEQELAYRPREPTNTSLPEAYSDSGIQLTDISSEKLPAAKAEPSVSTQSVALPKSPRKRSKGQKVPGSIASPRKPRKAVADSEDDEEDDTIVVNGAKDADFVPDADIMSHSKTTKPKSKQKRQKPNPPVDPLFWQPFELTGDLIDDPDDDGEGLHGVGFELPPERAYAVRREKRQKITAWKATVASEARMARSNRRSIFGPHSDSERAQGDITAGSAIDAAAMPAATEKKVVRFAA